MQEELVTYNIITSSPDSTNQNTKQASVRKEQVVQLQTLISEHLVTMHDEIQKIIKNIRVSTKQYPIRKLHNVIFEHIANMHDKTQIIIEITKREDQVPELKQVISEQIRIMELETSKIISEACMAYSSRVLFIVAEIGNTNFLVELIRQYPDLIWKVNDDMQSIFHIGVIHRHPGIYNLLYEIGVMKDLITPLKDANDNNMLHLAGKMATKERLADVSGAALQMHSELLWFKVHIFFSNPVTSFFMMIRFFYITLIRCESLTFLVCLCCRKYGVYMVPPSCREQKNKDGLTPRELFTEEHKELIREGEKWMKEASSQCMVVAALIATIVFAAAFTVPDRYNQIDGIPIFYRKAIFIVFVVADAMSLFLSSASILTFLSILTSRYAECDFVESLPTKLMLGLLTLFLSIATMVITFSISFFILYHKEMKWIPILMSVVALMPVLLYVVQQYHVLADVIRSSYGSRYLFKPEKQVLYYVNTKPQDLTIVVSEP
ncbi:putative PGG domain-containing protein [Helianthus debilis subsp. tardiflorus]